MVHSLSRRYPHTTSRAFLLMLACTLFTSGGQLLLKKGAQGIIPGQVFSYANLFVILGLAAYGVAAILMIASLRSGEVSILFPVLAVSYVLIALLSPLFFSTDSMNAWKWVGIIIIICSLSFLEWGGLNSPGETDG